MKIFISLLIINCSIISQTGWYQQYSLPNYSFRGIYFLNSNTGWVTAYSSGSGNPTAIIKTTNGGSNWNIISSIQNSNLVSIYFKDNLTGFACGQEFTMYEACIFKTTNGGTNWILQEHNGFWPLNCITFSNDTTGWCVGWDNLSYRTTDAGNNWVIYGPASGSELNFIFFINSLTGWIAAGGESGAIIKTTNGGINWTSQVHMWTGYTALNFVNPNFGWACGYNNNLNGVISKTTNGGTNWNIQPMGNNTTIASIFFVDTLKGWCIFGNESIVTICRTINGGLTWNAQTASIPGLSRLYFSDSLSGWALATGQILRTTTGGVTGINREGSIVPDKFSLSQNYPNPFNPSTKIKFDIAPVGDAYMRPVQLTIYDALGREVATLVNEALQPGTYEVDFDGTNFASGVYYYTLSSNDFIQTKRMMMAK